MNKREFIELLDQPIQFDSDKIESIQSLVQEYPYFQSSQLLLTKAFHSSENFNFEQQLRRTAAYAADRKVLHELLFSETAIAEENPELKVQDELVEIKASSVPENILENTKEEIELRGIVKETQSVNSNEQEKGNPISKIDILQESLNEDLLEQQILTSAINSSILLEVSDNIDLDDLPIKVNKVEIDQIKYSEEVSINSFDESVSHSFTGWLSHFKDEEPEKPIWESEKEVNRIKIIVSEKNQLPSKQEFYSPAKMAKLSVQENDDLVTETLANIYADQGNFEKAIKSFKKLQLKYPEKKIYFAGRIKEIENQLNTL